jgi:PE-PPE domain-containing protein
MWLGAAGTSNCYDWLWGLAVRRLIHSVGVVFLVMSTTVVLVTTQTMTALVALTATALIMGGTGHPLSTPQDTPEFIDGYANDANNDYILLTGFCGTDACTPTAVSTPEQFAPVAGTMPFDQSVGQGVGNLDQAINAQPAGESLVVFGYSQSARIASIEKGNLAAAGSTLPVSFVLIGNPNRPNGGILQRFEGLSVPIAGITFDGATPTNTDFKTVDVTRQYDGYSDFPNNPLNPFATANAIAGIQYVHGDYQSVGLGNALYQGSYGDTDYYMIPSQRLPLLMPLDQAGVPSPIVTMLDAPARVLVESGYDRTISPGAPTTASIMYFPDPVKTGTNFIIAIPTGIDDGAQEAANIRPFGTPPIDQRSPYGVGGPPVNAGSFDSTGAPIASTPAAAPMPSAQPLPAPKQWSAPSAPAAAPSVVPPVSPADRPATGITTPWWKPAQPAKPYPADMPQPAPVDLPKPVPVDLPKPAPAPAELPKPVPADLPAPALPRTDFLPKLAPPKVDPPVQAPAPVYTPPDIPAVAPLPPPVAAPALPDLPAAPPPQLPALPPMPALPPPPPLPALPNIPNILGGFRLPF